MSGLLEQLLEEVRALRGDVESLRNGITGTAMHGIELAHGALPEAVVQRLVDEVAARCADEVREQVEAILATAEPDERPERATRVPSVSPAPAPASAKTTPATQTSPAKRAPRQDLAALLARTIDTLERDPARAWKSAELRAAIKLHNGSTWARIATRLANHPAVAIAGDKIGRTYRAVEAAPMSDLTGGRPADCDRCYPPADSAS